MASESFSRSVWAATRMSRGLLALAAVACLITGCGDDGSGGASGGDDAGAGDAAVSDSSATEDTGEAADSTSGEPDSSADADADGNAPDATPDAQIDGGMTDGGADSGPADASVDAPMDSTGPLDTVEPPDPPDVDCDNIPPGPFTLVKLQGPVASEDLAFDRDGHLVGSNDQTIFRSPYPGQGSPFVYVPSIKFRAGMRFLPNGQLIVCDSNKGQLTRIDELGVQHTIVSGLSYPNGIIVDLEGWIYFTEQNADTVSRVHPFTGERQTMTDKVSAPNGLTFSPDYKTLYIGGFSGEGVVYALSVSEDGVPGKAIKWAQNVGSGALDGMGTDACGNVYICDYGQTVVYRITPDGQTITPIIDGDSMGAYLPNMQWGSGIGGWDSLSLYLPDGWKKEVFEVHVGVPGAPRPFP